MLIAVAAMASVSCQKEEAQAPETISTILTVHADVEATKTYLGEGNNVLWGKGEAVQLYVGVDETSKFVSSTSTDAYDGAASASFSFAIDGIEATGPYSLGGIYPASVALDNDDPTKFKTILPQNQNAEVGKYDPSAYIMVLKPATVDALPTEYTASFRRATALNKVTLTNVAEDITSVEITVPADKYLAGRRYFDLTTGESADVYYDKSSTITVNSAFTGNSIDVWFCSWGVELAAGEELTITMKSATKSYTRTITAKENGIKFVEGNLNTLAINMVDAVVENIVDFGGEWLITGTADGDVYAAKAYSTGNNLSSPVQITVAEDGSIDEVDGIEQCKMTFTKVTEGEFKGMYTIQDAGGKYLYAASSSKNYLKGGAAAESANYYWTVECNEGAYSIVASKSSNRNVMQFNPNNGTPLFSCYSSASQSPVTLYSYSMVKADTTPRITVEDTEYNVSADDETLEFGYTTKNIDGTPTVSVDGATMTNVEADAEAGIVTVIFDANAEEVEKTATLILSYDGAESVYVTITQAAKAAQGGGDVTEPITVSKTIEVLADANGWTNSTKYDSVKLDEVITATAISEGSNTGKYYTNGENWRIYQNETPSLTISATGEYTINTVKITYSVSNSGVLTLNGSNVNSDTVVSVNASSISFGVGNTGTATNGQVRVTAIEVVYQAN